MIIINNNGQSIESTNYWQSELASNGLFFASWNAGALRILMPDIMLSHLADMRTGKLAVVTRGTYQGKPDALEIMFDDDSDNPYAIHLSPGQLDRTIPDDETGHAIIVIAVGRSGPLAQWHGRYRTHATLPYLAAWITH